MIATPAQAPILRHGALPRSAKVALGLLSFLGIAALFGGWGMIAAAPGEAALGMPVEWLKNSPFTSYFIPGILLFGVFGLGSLAAVTLGMLRHWVAPYVAFTVGVGQMIWIAVEAVMMREVGFHPLQPTMFLCGAIIALSAYGWWRATSVHS